MTLHEIHPRFRIANLGIGIKVGEKVAQFPQTVFVEEVHIVWKQADINTLEEHPRKLILANEHQIDVQPCQQLHCAKHTDPVKSLVGGSINTDPLTKDLFYWKP